MERKFQDYLMQYHYEHLIKRYNLTPEEALKETIKGFKKYDEA